MLRKYMQKCNLSNQNQKKTLNKDKSIAKFVLKKTLPLHHFIWLMAKDKRLMVLQDFFV